MPATNPLNVYFHDVYFTVERSIIEGEEPMMTLNAFRYYSSAVAPGEVASHIGGYGKFSTCNLIKKVLLMDVDLDWRLLELVFAFTFSVVNAIIILFMCAGVVMGVIHFFSICICGSLFLLDLKAFVRENVEH
jgi:hypothetical protein